ncbi:MAG TPA: CDP-diacylglycerol--serine O-phosphatidyltransferase [Thermopetrobacter sp.]|nr:CDP-diacylglycerol--serine O-phosphatidyltransferase [Thermopetrobacter sp.]
MPARGERTRGRMRSEFSLVHLLPNMMTIAAICAGLTAIRAGVGGHVASAVLFILAAGVLDGLDGRVARLLRSDSKMGAELDSLGDFLNFGVAPALILYFWALQDMSRGGWIAVLVFAVCCVLRLARFNVAAREEQPETRPDHFVGVPAPAGALLVLLPIYLFFASGHRVLMPDLMIAAYMVLVGLLMISRIPTWSFKSVRISRENVKYLLVGFAFLGAAILTYAWVTLVALCALYAASLLGSALGAWRRRHRPAP